VTPDREQAIERICQAALERDGAVRDAFLADACGTDIVLRREVEALLAHEDTAEGFLDRPALAIAAHEMSLEGHALRAGQRLGHYTIVSRLGAGGMGEVYRARDGTLGRDVAIKILPSIFMSDGDRLARFEREARVLAALNHPNIATIYGVERVDLSAGSGQAGIHALVLEVVEGETLADRVSTARTGLPLSEAFAIARQIVEALETAHEKGIVHRDLKPANIKIRPDGVVKVLDFGLAKLLQNGPSSIPGRTASLALAAAGTSPGVILGTPGYMSPEQAKGNEADQRSDMFSLGCILYELLTGRQAFEGETASEILAGVLKAEVDFAPLRARFDPRLIDLLRRCLEKNPRQRWHAAADVRIELEAVMGRTQMVDEPRQLAGQSQGMWKRAVAVTASLVITALGFGYSAWMLKPEPPRSVTRFVIPLPEGHQFTDQSGQIVAISPDGTNVVYVANQRLYLRAMSGLEARALPGSEGNVSSPVFSPDGRTVAFYSVGEGALKRLDIAGGAPATIAKMDRPFGLSWSEQDIVFSLIWRGILRVPSRGGVPEILIHPVGDEVASSPQMLPGRRGVLFSVRPGGTPQDHGRVVVEPLGGGERKTLVEGGLDGRYLATGHLVYAISGDLFAVPFDLASLSVSGVAVPIVEGIRRSTLIASPATAQFSYSATGSMAFLPGPRVVSDANVDLALFDRNGTPTPLGLPPRPYRSPRVSPDGMFVAYDIEDAKGAAVWVYELAGGKAMRQLTSGGKSRHPIWSRDGQWVAFQSDREGDLGIFRQRADGSRLPERLTKPEGGTEHVPQSWSKDAGQLLFSVLEDKVWTLWTLSMKDRQEAPFGDVHSIEPAEGAFSPDGQWVAYRSRESEATPGEVYLQPFPATGAKHLVRNGSHVYWSPSGDELIVNAGPGRSVVIPVTTTSTTATFRQEREFPRGARREGPRPTRREVDSMPDGEHVIGVMVGGGESRLPQINVVLNWFDEVRQRVPKR
jgi:serine/threonine protein kinase/Tol biopolymer transport system component